jgi:hypothetical protein
MIKNIYVFDFDGTLMNSPLPEEGKKQWSTHYGRAYPHLGWWGRTDSLDPRVFKIEPLPQIKKEYDRARKDPEGLVIMLTSRMERLRDYIIYHLDEYDFIFDDYLFKRGNLQKSDRIDHLLLQYPEVEKVEIWDDRLKEISLYNAWQPERDLEVKIHFVEEDGRFTSYTK